MMQIVLVDKDDKILRYKEKYAAHKNPVALHRAISVIIFDKDGRMLLQKRAKEKPTWPGFWSNACCTHPLPKESYKAAAERRLKEEMGFTVPLRDKFNFIYKAEYNKEWGEHELDHVFIGKYSGKVKPDPNEAEDYKWMEIEDLLQDVKKNPDKYTPWFKIILEKLYKT
jgi:isopentenyl-diphosphate delta-isomerase